MIFIYFLMATMLFHWDWTTIYATSSNHSKIIAIHEANHERIWLRSVIQHIHEKCGLSSIKIAQRYYTKIILLVSLKLEETISKVTEPSTWSDIRILYSFSLANFFFSHRIFPWQGFNEACIIFFIQWVL